jgi:glycosyltransferase involved in cell wall biosynthesis
MARGKPVVPGTHGGAKEIVEHGVNGFVEDCKNIERIYDHILELLKNEKKRKRLVKTQEEKWKKVLLKIK